VLELVFSRFSVPAFENDAVPGDLVKPTEEE